MAKRLTVYPWWYIGMKWFLPVGLGLLACMWAILTINGAIHTFATLQWLPLLYQGLGVLHGGALLCFFALSVGALTFLNLSLFVRGTVLFNLNEQLVANNQMRLSEFEIKLEEKEKELEDFKMETDRAIVHIENEKEQLALQYHQLVGSSKSKPSPTLAKEGELDKALPTQSSNEPTVPRRLARGRGAPR